MRPFTPSPEFQTFFDLVVAHGNDVWGTSSRGFSPVVPTFTNPEEQAFTQERLVPFIAKINALGLALMNAWYMNEVARSTPYTPDPSSGGGP